MNVFMIEPLGDGGIAHYTRNLLEALNRLSIELTLLTNRKYEFATKPARFDVCPRMFRMASFLTNRTLAFDREFGVFQMIRRVTKLLEYPFDALEALILAAKRKANIVHIQSVNEIELLMLLLFIMAGHRVIFTIHNVVPRHGRLRWYHILVYRLMYSLCNHLIIHTEQGKREVHDLFKVDLDKITVIPHGDYKFFVPESPMSREAAREALHIDNNSKTILFFGAVRRNKGLDILLSALPEIRKHSPAAMVMIVGEQYGDYLIYRRIIEEHGLENCVIEKLEYIENEGVPLYFLAADIVVLPYREVTGSGVLQIAYAFGKPIVASDLAGFREVVEHGANGYLFESENAADLSDKIVDILSDPKRAEAMGDHSRMLCDKKYSWDGIARLTLGVYSHMVS